MSKELRQEFQMKFTGKKMDQEEIEAELFSIALKNNQPVTSVMLQFYEWIGLTGTGKEQPDGVD